MIAKDMLALEELEAEKVNQEVKINRSVSEERLVPWRKEVKLSFSKQSCITSAESPLQDLTWREKSLWNSESTVSFEI